MSTQDPFAASGGGVQVNGGWVPKDHPLAQQAAPDGPAPASPSAPAGGPSTSPSAASAITSPNVVGAQTPQGAPQTVAGAFQQALVNKLSPAPMDANNPTVRPAIVANQGAEQRMLEKNRAVTAERAAAQGLDQNAFNSQLMGLSQESAGRQGQFAGNAVMQAARDEAQQLMQALSMGAGMLSQQDQLAMTERLAQLQAAISREGIGSQARLGEGQLNLGLLNSLMGNDQFSKGLGAQLGMFNTSQNSAWMQALLGML